MSTLYAAYTDRCRCGAPVTHRFWAYNGRYSIDTFTCRGSAAVWWDQDKVYAQGHIDVDASIRARQRHAETHDYSGTCPQPYIGLIVRVLHPTSTSSPMNEFSIRVFTSVTNALRFNGRDPLAGPRERGEALLVEDL